jgi:hypothetical protein
VPGVLINLKGFTLYAQNGFDPADVASVQDGVDSFEKASTFNAKIY